MTELTREPPRRAPSGGGAARLTPGPLHLAVPAAAALAFASAGMLLRVEPFVTFFYIWAWYPTIVLLDCAVAARSGSYYLLTRPRFALSLFSWSAVLWFFFELINFRLQNWYYVSLPGALPIRWFGVIVSFATVLPAIFLAEKWLESRGAFVAGRWPTFRLSPRLLRAIFSTGILFMALSLIWPRYFFPLIWGALSLVLEPWNYRRDPRRSLFADLAAGRPGRVLRLLAAGLAIGFIWEMYNVEARAKWIYTVPGLENFKLFEMPLLGFLGFPVFALDCFVVYQALVLARVAVPPELDITRGWLRPRRTLAAAAGAALFSLATLVGMDRWNVDSLAPRLEGLWLAEPTQLERLARTPYADLFKLAEADTRAVAAAAGVDERTASAWVDAARLATLRGLGTANARLLWRLGIRSVADLAEADPVHLAAALRRISARPGAGKLARVRVWVAAARRASSSPQL